MALAMIQKDSEEYIQRLREMSGAMRVKIAADLSWATREIAKAAIRNEHPDWKDSQIETELLKRIYGSNFRP